MKKIIALLMLLWLVLPLSVVMVGCGGSGATGVDEPAQEELTEEEEAVEAGYD